MSEASEKAPPLPHPGMGAKATHRRFRLNIEVRQAVPPLLQAAVLATGLIAGLATAVAILWISGVDPLDLAREVTASFGNAQNVAAILVQAAPLIAVGIAAVIAFRVRFWNIGIEGQMITGAIAATGVALGDIGPEPLRIYLMFAAAAAGGMAWIVIPALLRIRFGVNEIISTLLFNYIAFNFLLHLLYGSWRDPASSFPISAPYGPGERLGLIGWENVTYALPVSVVLAAACWWVLAFSRFGFLTRFAQANPRMALAMGVPVTFLIVASALVSGALSGVAGFSLGAGIEYRMTQSFFVGYGFSGILIAFLGRGSAIGAVLVSLLVAVLFVVGQSLQVFYQIPGSMVQFIQAVVVIFVACSEFFVRYRVRRVR